MEKIIKKLEKQFNQKVFILDSKKIYKAHCGDIPGKEFIMGFSNIGEPKFITESGDFIFEHAFTGGYFRVKNNNFWEI